MRADAMKTGKRSDRRRPRQGQFPACPTQPPAGRCAMFIAWTTVANRADADRLATDTIARNLAVCVQIDGPISSHYRWEGKVEQADEFRLLFKCLPEQLPALEQSVLGAHPYDTPEWLV